MTGIVFDVGGTNMRLALTRDARRFILPTIMSTPKDFGAGMRRLAAKARQLAGDRRITVIAGGVPGPLNARRTAMLGCRHLPRWAGKDVAASLQRAFRAPVFLENDSALAGLGEATAGAGRGRSIVAYINVGTGIGGARIVDSVVDRSAYGFEPGHQLVDFRRPVREWEHVISGSAIWARLRRAPSSIHSASYWRRAALPVALGLVNVVVFWSPELIVLGGSMFKRWGIPLSDVRRRLVQYVPLLPKPPQVVRGTLGDLAGLWGALALIRQRLQ